MHEVRIEAKVIGEMVVFSFNTSFEKYAVVVSTEINIKLLI